MADVIIDGYINAWLVPVIPNIAAPVAATIAAGNSIEMQLTQEGLNGLEATTNWVNNSALGSTFDTQLPGLPGSSGNPKSAGSTKCPCQPAT